LEYAVYDGQLKKNKDAYKQNENLEEKQAEVNKQYMNEHEKARAARQVCLFSII